MRDQKGGGVACGNEAELIEQLLLLVTIGKLQESFDGKKNRCEQEHNRRRAQEGLPAARLMKKCH
jgi:hypothetical protein